KWVLDQKFDTKGNWIRNRTRWVVCGNFENNSWNSIETYSAVVTSTAVKIFLTLIAIFDLECEHFDVVTAFLNTPIPEDTNVYVQQPIGYEDGTDRVCKLIQALYGLRKSPIWWLVLSLRPFKSMDSDHLALISASL